MRPARLLSVALLLIASIAYLQAQESYPLSLVVEQSNKPEEVIKLADIQKITFAEGKMQMHYTGEPRLRIPRRRKVYLLYKQAAYSATTH